jgi:hypothetical protein
MKSSRRCTPTPAHSTLPRSTTATRTAATATTAALLLALTGCGSSETSSPSSSSSSDASVSASAVPSESASSGASSSGSQATPAIVAAGKAFLATLSSSEKSTALFNRDDTAQKQRWSNLPTGLYDRQGLAIGDMSRAQVNAFLALMRATLSTEGYNRVDG